MEINNNQMTSEFQWSLKFPLLNRIDRLTAVLMGNTLTVTRTSIIIQPNGDQSLGITTTHRKTVGNDFDFMTHIKTDPFINPFIS